MKKASIVSIGDELLSGQTSDCNAVYLSQELLSIGLPVVGSYTVGDRLDSIVRILKLAGEDSDFVLTTGGLGPTDDDLTRQALAQFLDTELHRDSDLHRKIEDFFVSRNLSVPAKAEVQAYIPAGAEALPNSFGTAAGIMAEMKGKLFVAMPGVPLEMQQMFQQSVLPRLQELTSNQTVAVRKLKCFGAAESYIAEKLGELMHRDRNPLINCTVCDGVITLHVIACAGELSRAEEMIEKDEALLRDILGELVYGTDEQTLAEVVGEELASTKQTIAVAESCTGGCLAKLITDVPGASRYFTHGWITYSNAAKSSQLDVPQELIEKYGAVSEEVAEAMAQGARKKADTTFAIGITGIAGPAGGSEQKPVGLTYICIDSDAGCQRRRFVMSGDRASVRIKTAQTALNMLRLKLQN